MEKSKKIYETVRAIPTSAQLSSDKSSRIHDLIWAELINSLGAESSISDAIRYLTKHFDPGLIYEAINEQKEKAFHETFAKAIRANLLLKEKIHMQGDPTIIPIRLNKEPLTPQTLAITFTMLTELTTKFWLIAKHRFVDLMEYTQTRDIRFANEAGSIITKVSYNSPFNFFWKVDLSAPSVAEAMVTTLDGIKQRDIRQQKAELENQTRELENQEKAQRIEEARQKAEHEQKMTEIDRQIKEFEFQQRQAEVMLKLEQQRSKLLERTLEILNKNQINAAVIAGRAVAILLPDGDEATKLMLGQSLLPNILQIQEVTGLELALTTPKTDEDNPKKTGSRLE